VRRLRKYRVKCAGDRLRLARRRNVVRGSWPADHGRSGKHGERNGESSKTQREGGVVDLAAEGGYDQADGLHGVLQLVREDYGTSVCLLRLHRPLAVLKPS